MGLGDSCWASSLSEPVEWVGETVTMTAGGYGEPSYVGDTSEIAFVAQLPCDPSCSLLVWGCRRRGVANIWMGLADGMGWPRGPVQVLVMAIYQTYRLKTLRFHYVL